jgi:hypothetical protein
VDGQIDQGDLLNQRVQGRVTIPGNVSTAEVETGAPHKRGAAFWDEWLFVHLQRFRIRRGDCRAALYVPLSWFVLFGLGLAFFDAIKTTFEQAPPFPTGTSANVAVPDRLGFVALSDWTILLIIAAALTLRMALFNKPRQTFQWPAHALRNGAIALALTVVVLWIMLSKPLLFFLAACVVSYTAGTLFWRWIGRPILIRARALASSLHPRRTQRGAQSN